MDLKEKLKNGMEKSALANYVHVHWLDTKMRKTCFKLFVLFQESQTFIFAFIEKGGNVIVSTEAMQPKYCCT